MSLIRAVEFATEKHRNYNRKNTKNGVKLPYIFHPMEVAKLVYDWGAGTEINMKASLGHDILEDTETEHAEVRQQLGDEAASIVMELTFLGGDKYEYIFSFAHKSVNALVIKLADRICNVYDFLREDPNYAVKYFHKAEPLWRVWGDRKGEVVSRFGEKTMNAIDDSINKLKVALGE